MDHRDAQQKRVAFELVFEHATLELTSSVLHWKKEFRVCQTSDRKVKGCLKLGLKFRFTYKLIMRTDVCACYTYCVYCCDLLVKIEA